MCPPLLSHARDVRRPQIGVRGRWHVDDAPLPSGRHTVRPLLARPRPKQPATPRLSPAPANANAPEEPGPASSESSPPAPALRLTLAQEEDDTATVANAGDAEPPSAALPSKVKRFLAKSRLRAASFSQRVVHRVSQRIAQRFSPRGAGNTQQARSPQGLDTVDASPEAMPSAHDLDEPDVPSPMVVRTLR